MASRDDNSNRAIDVQVLPASGGGVTTLHGSGIATFPTASDITTPAPAVAPVSVSGGAAPGGWQPWTPVMMPQPSVIVVTVDKTGNKPGEKPEKQTSEVFKRI